MAQPGYRRFSSGSSSPLVLALMLCLSGTLAVAQTRLPQAPASPRVQLQVPSVTQPHRAAASDANESSRSFSQVAAESPLRVSAANGNSVLTAGANEAIYPPPADPWDYDFSPTPLPAESLHYNPFEERRPYDGKTFVPVQRPILEFGRPFYLNGMLPRSSTILGETNLVLPHFYVYGDYRAGYGGGWNAGGEFHNYASQARLDIDWMFTSTERIHAFIQPMNRGGDFTGIDFSDGDFDFQQNYNADLITLFFEGDLGAIMGGLTGTSFPFDLPISAGLVPLLYQNGIWMEDAITGVAFALPSRNSKRLGWSNFDATMFAGYDEINSDAFGADSHGAQLLGTAWFIEAYEGYIETGYAYVRDRRGLDRSYHNFTWSFARRYFWRLSNTIRIIANLGQDLPRQQRTADGALLLLENAWVSHDSLRYVPYLNLFAGFGRPQSVARAGASGGILRNTGINFESDNLNGFPTLDATARNTYGAALGVNLLGAEFDHQLVLECAVLGVMENADDRNARGNQAAIGARYQLPISHRTLLRFDGMWAHRDRATDLVGGRMEYRWKF